VTLRTKLSIVPALVLLALGALVAGCSTTDTDQTAGWSPNKIYSEAQDEMNSGNYDKSVGLF
jgi:outer membrane protein assembly factor BamD